MFRCIYLVFNGFVVFPNGTSQIIELKKTKTMRRQCVSRLPFFFFLSWLLTTFNTSIIGQHKKFDASGIGCNLRRGCELRTVYDEGHVVALISEI